MDNNEKKNKYEREAAALGMTLVDYLEVEIEKDHKILENLKRKSEILECEIGRDLIWAAGALYAQNGRNNH